MSRDLVARIDVESVRFSDLGVEWEIEIVREDGDNIYHYTHHPDTLYDQLSEQGELIDDE